MTKQEEIREGMQKWVCPIYPVSKENCGNCVMFHQSREICERQRGLVKYLHSQGVVIKVDRELGCTPTNSSDWSKITMEEVEPLIKEKAKV